MQHKTITNEINVNEEEDILIIQNIINISLYKLIEVGELSKKFIYTFILTYIIYYIQCVLTLCVVVVVN
jgi:hypothetical protein